MNARRDALLVGVLAFTSRLPWLTPVEQDLDGSRFVRALLRFDLAQGHPHPPGYPLFIALGTVAMRVLRDPARALSLVSALSFALTCAIVFTLAATITRSRAAPWLAALTFALGTLATVHSTRPLSDMTGCALAWAALSIASSPAHSALHGALVGMVAAARPSALPLVAWGALGRVRRPRRVAFVVACVLTTVALYAPAVMTVGVRRFVALATEHAEGHFTRFGGSVVTRPDLVERARAFAFGLHAHVLGGWWRDRAWPLLPASVALWALLVAGLARLSVRASCRPVVASCALYAAWVFFGQNVVWQPRHLLPLAPAFALLVGLGFDALFARTRTLALTLAFVALAPSFVESSRLLRAQSIERPPTLRLVDEIARHCDPSRTLVATGQLGTWIRYRASGHRVVEVRDVDEALALGRRNRVGVCVTSEVSGVASHGLRRVARVVGDRYVTSTLYDLALWSAP
jgi:Protein of unknown function (DUF2723)